jgi:hypothetical protein
VGGVSATLDAARDYARKGHRVLPDLGKRPPFDEWQKLATSDLAQIEAWWQRWPEANVGLLCGCRFVVLDVDPRHGGDAALAALEAEHGKLPETARVATGGGGWHHYFGAGAVASWDPGPGLELRASGRQVVAPPSIHPDTGREYVWITRQSVAPLPAWLTVATATRGPIIDGEQPLVPIGQRHHALVRFLGLLRSMGFGEAALVAFADVFLDHAVEVDEARCPLDRKRARVVARSIARRYPPHVNREEA